MRHAVTQHLHTDEGSCLSLDKLLFYCTAHFSQTMKINKEVHWEKKDVKCALAQCCLHGSAGKAEGQT